MQLRWPPQRSDRLGRTIAAMAAEEGACTSLAFLALVERMARSAPQRLMQHFSHRPAKLSVRKTGK